MDIGKLLKRAFREGKENSKSILIALILLFVILIFSNYLKSILFSIIFIILGGASKLYHRIFRSTIGIDLVLFFTLMVSLVYSNLLLSFLVGFTGLIMADMIGTRLSHTTLVSLLALTAVILLSGLFSQAPMFWSLLILTVVFEIITIIFYNLLGSSPDKIILFAVTHFMFNLFLIVYVSNWLAGIMV